MKYITLGLFSRGRLLQYGRVVVVSHGKHLLITSKRAFRGGIGNHPSRYLIAVYLCCPRSLPRWPFLPHSSGIQQGNGLSWAIPVVVHPTNSAKRVIRKPVRRKPESEGKFFVRKEKAFTHLITKVMHDNARAVIEWLGRALEMEFMFAGL